MHQRWLEGECIDRINHKKKSAEICQVDYDLVRKIVEKNFGFKEGSYDVFIGSDQQRKANYDSFLKFGDRWKKPKSSTWGVLHDAWMLAHTDLFLGNIASTLSYTIQLWHKNLVEGALEYEPPDLRRRRNLRSNQQM